MNIGCHRLANVRRRTRQTVLCIGGTLVGLGHPPRSRGSRPQSSRSSGCIHPVFQGACHVPHASSLRWMRIALPKAHRVLCLSITACKKDWRKNPTIQGSRCCKSLPRFERKRTKFSLQWDVNVTIPSPTVFIHPIGHRSETRLLIWSPVDDTFEASDDFATGPLPPYPITTRPSRRRTRRNRTAQLGRPDWF